MALLYKVFSGCKKQNGNMHICIKKTRWLARPDLGRRQRRSCTYTVFL